MAVAKKLNITTLGTPAIPDGFTIENIRHIFEEVAQQMALSPEQFGGETPAVWHDVGIHKRRKFFRHDEKPYTRTKHNWTQPEKGGA